MSQGDEYPKSPMPEQKQEGPGLESEMTPRPDYKAPDTRARASSRTRSR